MVYIAKSGAGQDATWPPAPEKIYTDDILVFNPVKGVEPGISDQLRHWKQML